MENKLTIIKCIRICLDMSQIEFAKIFGCSHNYLCEIEKGEKKFSFDKLSQGLSNIHIPYEEYQKLELYLEKLEQKDMEYQKKFQLLLLKVVTVIIKIEKTNKNIIKSKIKIKTK